MAKIDHTGEVIHTKYGVATIVKYNSRHDSTVSFEGYGIKEHVDYGWLLKGKVLPPGAKKGIRKDHIGEIYPDIEDNPAECIDYINYRDCTIRFVDGSIKEHVSFALFKSGRLSPHENRAETIIARLGHDRVGEKKHMNNGMIATITEYHSNSNITVQFEDGTVKQNVPYGSFVSGEVMHPEIKTQTLLTQKALIGKVFQTTKCGKCTVIEYNNSKNVIVQFEDGTKVKVASSALYKGEIENPNGIASKYIGRNAISNSGVPFTIINIVKTRRKTDNHVQWITTVKFADGTYAEGHETPARIVEGYVSHPSFKGLSKICKNPLAKHKDLKHHIFLDYEVYGRAFNTCNTVYYYCRKKDSIKPEFDILTPAEMLSRSKSQEEAA